MKKRFLAYLLIITLCLGLLTACGANSGSSDAAADAPAASMPGESASQEMMDSENGFSHTTAGSAANFSAIRQNAKLILNAEVEAEATDFENVESAIQNLTAEAGGYIESSSIGGSVGYRWANFTLRVPQEKFESFLAEIGNTCHVTYQTTGSKDVTEKYYDTEARLATQTTKQERLLALLDKAEDIEDIIALETALAEVNYEIESLTGTLRNYDNLVGFSTITLMLNEVRDLTAMQETPSFGSELKQAFLSGSRDFVDFLQGLILGLAMGWPFLIALFIAILIPIKVCRKRPPRRRPRIQLRHDDTQTEAEIKTEEQ